MLPVPKLYKIDYEFIIKNYLDKSLWKKQWNLFIYKDYVVTLSLYNIHTKDDIIEFEIKLNKVYYHKEYIKFFYNTTPIKVFKQQIEGAIWRCLVNYDDDLIRTTDGYREINAMRDSEMDRLTDIARNFLDENGVTNDEIRDVYIDNYVSNNTKTSELLSNYLFAHKYHMLTDVLLVFAKITNNDDYKSAIIKHVDDKERIRKIENEIKNFTEIIDNDSHEYWGEMEYALEAI